MHTGVGQKRCNDARLGQGPMPPHLEGASPGACGRRVWGQARAALGLGSTGESAEIEGSQRDRGEGLEQ